MEDIRTEILKRYNIDILKENIFEFYKIDNCNISYVELKQKFRDARENLKLNTDSNITVNELMAYEKIMENIEIRNKLFYYYNNYNYYSGTDSHGNYNSVEFAKNFFSVIIPTKKIEQSDIAFFFNYFKNEREQAVPIIKMLKKQMKIKGLKYNHCLDEFDWSKEKTINNKNHVVISKFQESTILEFGRVVELYETLKKEQGFNYKLSEYLKLDSISDSSL